MTPDNKNLDRTYCRRCKKDIIKSECIKCGIYMCITNSVRCRYGQNGKSEDNIKTFMPEYGKLL